MQTAPKMSHTMHMPADANTLTPCLRYLSRDRERDQRCGRALQAAGEPRRGRVWTRPKRTCRLFRRQSIGVGGDRNGESKCWGEQRRAAGKGSQSPEQEEGRMAHTGNKAEKKAETEGALAQFPASVPKGDPGCLPLSLQHPRAPRRV